jgi:hypothetical protein
MKTRLEEVLALVLEALKDKEQVIRWVLWWCFFQWSWFWLPPFDWGLWVEVKLLGSWMFDETSAL